jgi:hypothetical protein
VKASSVTMAVVLALTPCPGRAIEEDDAGPLCDDSRAILTGERADCDGVLIGPKRLGALLEDRERLATCGVDLRLARDMMRVEVERCDGRLQLVTQALERANAKLLEPPRWQWETAVVGLALGLVLGAGATAWLVSR